jgi:outer membrane protein TolC
MKKYIFLIIFFISFNLYASNIKILTLAKGIKYTLQYNRGLKVFYYNHTISQANANIAKSPLFPQVNTFVSQTYLANQPLTRFEGLVLPTSEKSFDSFGIDATQTLYDFGASHSFYKSKKTDIKISDEKISLIKNITLLNFINTYFNCLDSNKIVLVAKEEVKSFQSHLKDAEDLFKQGVITKNDLLQAEVKLADARQRLITAKNNRRIQYEILNNMMGQSLTTQWKLQDIPLNTKKISIEIAIKTAEKKRKELKILNNQFKSLYYYKKYFRAKYFPKLFIEGDYSYVDLPYDETSKNQWALILGINLNIFNGWKTKYEIKSLQEQQKQILEEKNKTSNDIKLEVEKNYFDVLTNFQNIQVAETTIRQSKENLRINTLKYREGIGTATDVIDAITLLTTARTDYYTDVYQYQESLTNLLYSMGDNLANIY